MNDMEFGKNQAVLKGWYNSGSLEPEETSFDAVLSSACDRLRDKHIQYSLRRIREMEGDLEKLEKELDEILRAAGH